MTLDSLCEEIFVTSLSNQDKKYSAPTVAVQGQLVHSGLFGRI